MLCPTGELNEDIGGFRSCSGDTEGSNDLAPEVIGSFAGGCAVQVCSPFGDPAEATVQMSLPSMMGTIRTVQAPPGRGSLRSTINLSIRQSSAQTPALVRAS